MDENMTKVEEMGIQKLRNGSEGKRRGETRMLLDHTLSKGHRKTYGSITFHVNVGWYGAGPARQSDGDGK